MVCEKPLQPRRVDVADPLPAAVTGKIRRFEIGGHAFAEPQRHGGQPLVEPPVEGHLMGGFVHKRGDHARRLRAAEDFESSPRRGLAGRPRQARAASEVERGDAVGHQVVVADHAVGGGAQIAGRKGFIPLPICEDHDQEWPRRRRHLDPRLLPEIGEGVVEPLEERGTPLGIGSRGVEADAVVFGHEQVEARRQLAEDPATEVPWRFHLGPSHRCAGEDDAWLHQFQPFVGAFQQESAIDGLHDHDPFDLPPSAVAPHLDPFHGPRFRPRLSTRLATAVPDEHA